jgi:hypothetical protein
MRRKPSLQTQFQALVTELATENKPCGVAVWIRDEWISSGGTFRESGSAESAIVEGGAVFLRGLFWNHIAVYARGARAGGVGGVGAIT